MGLFFSLLYIFTALIGPQVLFGDLVQYHIEVILVLLAFVCSLPSLQGSDLLGSPQTFGVLGLTLAAMLSIALNGWVGGMPTVLGEFTPGAITFFLVLLNCKKKIHLQILVAMLVGIALFTIYRGFAAEREGNDVSLYVITMKNSTGAAFYRIRGADFLNDPNDFAQFMIGLIPCVFLFWSKGKFVRNLLFVFLPVSLLLCGMYLTHSRGGMIAMMAAAAVAGRRKFGLVRSMIVGAVVFVAISAAGFSGGRDVSMESGSDRLDAWAAGLQMIRSHPIFGVGFGRFTDFHAELTAHNTIVLCAAELGLFGLFFWLFWVLPTIRDAYVANATPTAAEKKAVPNGSLPSGLLRPVERVASAPIAAMPVPAVSGPRVLAPAGPAGFINPIEDKDPTPDAEIHRMAGLMLVSLVGLMTAGWFLARAYTMVLFVNTGIAAAVYKMARDRKITPPPLPVPRAAMLCAVACVVLIAAVWLTLRIDHLLPS